MKIVINSMEDFDAALPHIVRYRPERGSLVLIDSELAPVAVLRPEVLMQSPEDLLEQLRVFNDRSVYAYRMGRGFATDFQDAILANLPVKELRMDRYLSMSDVDRIFAGKPSREEFIAQDPNILALGYALATAVANGDIDRP